MVKENIILIKFKCNDNSSYSKKMILSETQSVIGTDYKFVIKILTYLIKYNLI